MESIIMNMLCSGNPNHNTVASAVKSYFPKANFASRATGYDLRFWDSGSETHFREQIINYDVFVNSSFICGGGQLALLEATHEEWAKTGIHGHIINIGSTSEYLGVNDIQSKDQVYAKYSIQKRALRDRSLQLNGLNNIKTTHIIAGGLNDGIPEHKNWLDLTHIAETIVWVIEHPCLIPLIEIRANGLTRNE
jgi:hypothetical protein